MRVSTIIEKSAELIMGLALFPFKGWFATYDHDQPDTPANRKGFEQYLGEPPSEDIRDIYHYVDGMGADVQIQLTFYANEETLDRIAQRLGLRTDAEPRGVGPYRAFDGWPTDSQLRTMRCRRLVNEREDYFRELWQDDGGRAVYIEFST